MEIKDLQKENEISLGALGMGVQQVGGGITEETDPTVPQWAKQPNKPEYDYSEIKNTPNLNDYAKLTDLENMADKTYVDDRVIRGYGKPTTSTIGKLGQIYEDITNGNAYICFGVLSNGNYSWGELLRKNDNGSLLANYFYGTAQIGVNNTNYLVQYWKNAIRIIEGGAQKYILNYPAEGGTIATEELVARASGTKLYKHTISFVSNDVGLTDCDNLYGSFIATFSEPITDVNNLNDSRILSMDIDVTFASQGGYATHKMIYSSGQFQSPLYSPTGGGWHFSQVAGISVDDTVTEL